MEHGAPGQVVIVTGAGEEDERIVVIGAGGEGARVVVYLMVEVTVTGIVTTLDKIVVVV